MSRVLSTGQQGSESAFEESDRLKKEAFDREMDESTIAVNKDTTTSGANQSKIVNLE